MTRTELGQEPGQGQEPEQTKTKPTKPTLLPFPQPQGQTYYFTPGRASYMPARAGICGLFLDLFSFKVSSKGAQLGRTIAGIRPSGGSRYKPLLQAEQGTRDCFLVYPLISTKAKGYWTAAVGAALELLGLQSEIKARSIARDIADWLGAIYSGLGAEAARGISKEWYAGRAWVVARCINNSSETVIWEFQLGRKIIRLEARARDGLLRLRPRTEVTMYG